MASTSAWIGKTPAHALVERFIKFDKAWHRYIAKGTQIRNLARSFRKFLQESKVIILNGMCNNDKNNVVPADCAWAFMFGQLSLYQAAGPPAEPIIDPYQKMVWTIPNPNPMEIDAARSLKTFGGISTLLLTTFGRVLLSIILSNLQTPTDLEIVHILSIYTMLYLLRKQDTNTNTRDFLAYCTHK